MISPLLPLAFLAGVALAIALGINTKFGKDLRSPVAAGTFSFAIGTAVLTAAALLTGEPWPSWATLGSTRAVFTTTAQLTGIRSLSRNLVCLQE